MKSSRLLLPLFFVLASLIVPALATHRRTKRRYIFAFAVGIAGYALGLLLSVWFDLPAGAAIVWAMALSGSVMLFSKTRA